MRTKAELLDIIYKNSDIKSGRASFKIRNPRMRQLATLLENSKLSDSELKFFEAEILTYQLKAQAAQKKRDSFIRQAVKNLA